MQEKPSFWGFTWLMNKVWFRHLGRHCQSKFSAYLDNLSPGLFLSWQRSFLGNLTDLGWLINTHKSDLQPSPELFILGCALIGAIKSVFAQALEFWMEAKCYHQCHNRKHKEVQDRFRSSSVSCLSSARVFISAVLAEICFCQTASWVCLTLQR